MHVRLLVDWGNERYAWAPAGTVVEVDAATGRSLMFGGQGEPVAGPLEVATRPAPRVAARVERATKTRKRRTR